MIIKSHLALIYPSYLQLLKDFILYALAVWTMLWIAKGGESGWGGGQGSILTFLIEQRQPEDLSKISPTCFSHQKCEFSLFWKYLGDWHMQNH